MGHESDSPPREGVAARQGWTAPRLPPHPASVLQCVPCGPSARVRRATTAPTSLRPTPSRSPALPPCECPFAGLGEREPSSTAPGHQDTVSTPRSLRASPHTQRTTPSALEAGSLADLMKLKAACPRSQAWALRCTRGGEGVGAAASAL